MQALCQWDVQQDESHDALGEFFTSSEVSPTAHGYARRLVEQYWTRQADIDARISSSAREWKLSRISPVERNIMRVAIVELGDSDVPPAVVLNEAIEIGREFGGADSPRFLNGVLDDVRRRMKG